MDTVVFGDSGVIVELDHLQHIHAHHECAGYGDDEQGAGDQPFVDQTLLFFMVLDGYGFRHFCSNSMTIKRGADPWA
jgi:hypothetical protein